MKTLEVVQVPHRLYPCWQATTLFWLSIVFLLAATRHAAAEGAPEQTVLTNARAVRVLSPEQAAKRYPVKLTGVITHANPHIGDFFIHDETSPIYVQPQGEKGLTLGDRVEVTGFTSAGGFAPCVASTSVKKLGAGTLPDPLPYDLNLEDSRWLDAHWVQCWAIIRGVQAGGGYTNVLVESRHGQAYLLIPGEKNASSFKDLMDASIRVRGVCVPHFNAQRVVDRPPRIFVHGLNNLVVLERADLDLVKLPALQLEQLLRFSPDPHPSAPRVKVIGVVTGTGPKTTFYIQDATAQACVLPVKSLGVTPGMQVEVVGRLVVQGASLRLDDATVNILSNGPAPEPRQLSVERVLADNHSHALVTLSGRVVEVNARAEPPTVTLQGGATTIDVSLPVDGPAIELVPDSRVEVTGIVIPTTMKSTPFRILVRQWADVNVLEVPPPPPPPPWWTTTRVLAALGVVALAAFIWVVTLRTRLRHQTVQLRKHFEHETRLEAQLLQAQKLEAVGRLAGGIAHDFNNLLTVINGCSDLLKRQVPPSGSLAELSEAIGNAGERAADLTRQLLLFSRHRSVALAPLDLNEVLADSERLLRRVIGEDVELTVTPTAGLPWIEADPGLIHQILLNLAVNARDAMPEQGKLILATTRAPDGKVRLCVSDTGCGMDEATQARLFEPFFTTKEVGKGTGLGLACVYGIVQTLRGEIRVRSAPRRGTTFEIDFPPVPAPSSPALLPRVAPVGGALLKGAVVLVVEDEPGVREMIRLVLGNRVSRLLVAASPSEALRIARECDTPIHVLLVDVVMPEMNGRVLAESLSHQYPELAVLFMSGYNSDEVLQRGLHTDKATLLRKPYTADMLIAKLSEVLQAHNQRKSTHNGARAGQDARV
jgi:signal transduction histidine kinase/CheY-like chemotaxis protein